MLYCTLYLNNKLYYKNKLVENCILDYEALNIQISDIHREDGPAVIFVSEQNKLKYVRYYKNGVLHRENGPARIVYNDYNKIEKATWLYNGLVHRENKPAIIQYFNTGKIHKLTWIKHGEIYRKNGPAIVEINGNKKMYEWYIQNTYVGSSYTEYIQFLYKNKEQYAEEYQTYLKGQSINIFN